MVPLVHVGVTIRLGLGLLLAHTCGPLLRVRAAAVAVVVAMVIPPVLMNGLLLGMVARPLAISITVVSTLVMQLAARVTGNVLTEGDVVRVAKLGPRLND